MPAPAPIRVFISYSHKDDKLCSLFRDHLLSLVREGLIEEWHDRKIMAGEEWDSLIKDNLLSANVILFLVTSSFLSSGYISSNEMKLALTQYEKGAARVIPIILKPVSWQSTVLGSLQALPVDGRPVTTWKNRDQAFFNIVEGVRSVVAEMLKSCCSIDKCTNFNLPMSRISNSNPPSEQGPIGISGQSRASKFTIAKSLIALDIDDFTVINRKHGPMVGDMIKTKMSQIISESLSKSGIFAAHDWIVPYSDEHYILVALSEEEAYSLADNLRLKIWKYDWYSVVHGLVVSVTCGISRYRVDEAAENVVIRALLGIKAGKLKCKNRVYKGPFFSRNDVNPMRERKAFMQMVQNMCSGDRSRNYKGYIDDELVVIDVERERGLFASNALSTIARFFEGEAA